MCKNRNEKSKKTGQGRCAIEVEEWTDKIKVLEEKRTYSQSIIASKQQ